MKVTIHIKDSNYLFARAELVRLEVEKIRSIKVYDEDDNEIPFEYERERVEEIKLTLN